MIGDNVVEFMLKLMISRLPRERKSKVWIFSSLKFAKLYVQTENLRPNLKTNKDLRDKHLENVFKEVIDETAPSLMELDVILFPIHHRFHWSLAVLLKDDTHTRRLMHLDSLGLHYNTEIIQTLKLYLLKKFTDQLTSANYVRLTNRDSKIESLEVIEGLTEADGITYKKVRAISRI